MTDPVRDSTWTRKWLWAIALIAVAIAASFWFARPLNEPANVEVAKPQPQSTEWAEEPEGPAVPVNLPNTPLKNVDAKAQTDGKRADEKQR